MGSKSMRRSWNDERICIPIAETTVEKALTSIRKANRLADIVELRIDYLKELKLAPFLKNRQKPIIITNRRKEEGGKYKDDEEKRLRILQEAVDLGVDYVDVEVRSKRSSLQALMANRKETQVVLSFHDFQRTPSLKELEKLLDRMIQLRANVVKIVTFAQSREDNLKILRLIPYARVRRQEIVAFCMGAKGKVSRVFSPFMGGAWTYASLSHRQGSAPGQLTVYDMRDIWKRLI